MNAIPLRRIFSLLGQCRRSRLSRGGLAVLLLATLIGGLTLNPGLARAQTSTTTVQSCYSSGQQLPPSTCESYTFSDTGESSVPISFPGSGGYFYACYLNGQTDPSCTVATYNPSIGNLVMAADYACFVNGQPSTSCTLFWGMSSPCISGGFPLPGAASSCDDVNPWNPVFTPTGKAFVQGPDGTYYICEVNGQVGGCAIDYTSDFSLISCYLSGGLNGQGCNVVTSPTAPSVALPPPDPAALLNQAALSASVQPPFIGDRNPLAGDPPAADGLYHATPAELQALQDLEQEAVADTVADHGLSSSDALAAQTWGRDDALAELWGLITQAINTSPSDRTTDQQGAVDWLTQVVQREGVAEAFDAGLEYTKWAGLDQSTYSGDADAYFRDQAAGNDTSADRSALEGFLNQTPQSFAVPRAGTTWTSSTNLQTLQDTATEGYCVYKSPSPDQTQYQGNVFSGTDAEAASQCFEPGGGLGCLFDCTPNAPASSSFVQWADDDVNYTLLNNPDFSTAFRDIALGVGLGGVTANVASALGLRGALNAIWAPAANGGTTSGGATGTTFGNSVMSQATKISLARNAAADAREFEAGAEASSEAIADSLAELAEVGAAAASVSDVGSVAAGVIFFVTTASVAIMNFVNNVQVPQQLASGIEGAPTQTVDLPSLLAGNNGAGELYSLFLLATLPAPAVNCNLVPPYNGTSTFGQICLNPPPPAAQGPHDPVFMVSENGGTASPQNTITWYDQASGDTITARLHETWFVEQATDSSGTPFETLDNDGVTRPQIQMLRILYTDWNGNEQQAWLENVPNAGYQFISINLNALKGTVLNPTTCSTDNTCSYTNSIDYVDSSGNKYSATVEVPPTVVEVPPTLALSAACPTGSPCDTRILQAGGASTLTGTITHAGSADAETVTVDWGDGASDATTIEPSGDSDYPWQTVTVLSNPVTLTAASSTVFDLSDTHTYASPGVYTVTVTVQDQSGATVKSTATEIVTGAPQTITFAPIPDHTYGDAPVFIAATGGGSGKPVTFSAAPWEVCSISGLGTDTSGGASYAALIALHAAGRCTVTAEQAGIRAPGGITIYPDAGPVQRSFQVNPAPLTITANDKSMTYGGAVPASFFDASYAGFVNGESAATLNTSLNNPPQCQPAGSTGRLPVGTHAITCIGAQDPNYSIAYQPGTLTVTPAPLTITANNQSMTYGGTVPAFTVNYKGLVNGDSGSVVTGLTCGAKDANGNPVSGGTPAGTYAITCSGGTAANYSISDVTGTLTINNPLPTTSGLSPAAVQAGGGAVAVTISGSGFVPASTVQVLSSGGATTLTPSTVSADGTQLTVTLPATLTAQASTVEVQVVNAAPGGGTSNIQPLFVTTASTTVASLNVSSGGTASTGGSGANTPGSVTVSGSGGTGILAVALYSANPGAPPRFAASSAYFDAYVAPGSSYSAVSITNCDLSGGQVALWYDAATSSWVQASNQSYDATTGCTTITVNATTTPSLAQLNGTPFAIADDPLLTLDAQGLPGSVPHQATLDGQTVSLPDKVAVPYNSSHSYSVPALVIDSSSGTAYFTADQGFSGPITATTSDTAVYQTMAQIVGAAQASGGIDNGGQANALTQQFAAVQADIQANNTSETMADLLSFAAHVQAQAGQHLTAATAQALLADAQLVYAHLGGTGQV